VQVARAGAADVVRPRGSGPISWTWRRICIWRRRAHLMPGRRRRHVADPGVENLQPRQAAATAPGALRRVERERRPERRIGPRRAAVRAFVRPAAVDFRGGLNEVRDLSMHRGEDTALHVLQLILDFFGRVQQLAACHRMMKLMVFLSFLSQQLVHARDQSLPCLHKRVRGPFARRVYIGSRRAGKRTIIRTISKNSCLPMLSFCKFCCRLRNDSEFCISLRSEWTCAAFPCWRSSSISCARPRKRYRSGISN
jgi:hypothetical protein